MENGVNPTKCATDLDQQTEMIVFESLLSTFEGSVFFKAAEKAVEIGSNLKHNLHD
jgi:hypothetical protein